MYIFFVRSKILLSQKNIIVFTQSALFCWKTIKMMVANVVKCCTRNLQRLHCTPDHRKVVTRTCIVIHFVVPVADPGFDLGGRDSLVGAYIL